MPRFTLAKNERLCGDKVISRLFEEGRRGFAYPFRYLWRVESHLDGEGTQSVDERPGDDDPCAAIFISVPKKLVRRAVKRNFIKRRMRESYRLNKYTVIDKATSAGKRVEIALVYVAKELPDFKTIENGVKRILAEIGKSI